MNLQLFHDKNFALSTSSVNVLASFWVLKEGRFNSVVGIHRLSAPRIRNVEYSGLTRRSISKSLAGFSKSSTSSGGDIIAGPPVSSLGGKVLARSIECHIRFNGEKGSTPLDGNESRGCLSSI